MTTVLDFDHARNARLKGKGSLVREWDRKPPAQVDDFDDKVKFRDDKKSAIRKKPTSEERFYARIHDRLMVEPHFWWFVYNCMVEYHFWWFVHNCVAHPLISARGKSAPLMGVART